MDNFQQKYKIPGTLLGINLIQIRYNFVFNGKQYLKVGVDDRT